MKKYKKTLLSIILGFYLLFTFSIPFAKAQWYNQSFGQYYTQVYGPSTPPQEIFGERYTAAQTQWVFYSMISLIVNFIGEHFFGPNYAQSLITFLATGTLSRTDSSSFNNINLAQNPPPQKPNENLITLVFEDRPLSGVTSIKQGFENFSLTPKVNAQETGFGFQALKPIQVLWRLSRDISYTLFVLATIALSFMIMFRVQLPSQMVVTVQSAIPKIAITLILVTFSYAIAGFMIDLMYVATGLISLLLSTTSSNPAEIFTYLTKGPELTGVGHTGIIGLMYDVIKTYFFSILAIIPVVATGGNVAATAGFTIVAIIVFVLVIIFAIFQFFKVLMTLFKAYAAVFLLTFIAPIQITAGLLYPSVGFSTWLKNLISNLAVFPTVGLLMLLCVNFARAAVQGFTQSTDIPKALEVGHIGAPYVGFSVNAQGYNDLTSQGWPPLIGFGSDETVYMLFFIISFTFLTMTPKVAETVKGFMKGQGGFQSTLGETWSGGTGMVAGKFGSKAAAQEDIAKSVDPVKEANAYRDARARARRARRTEGIIKGLG